MPKATELTLVAKFIDRAIFSFYYKKKHRVA
jgi:hypothetical protein